MFGEKSKRGVQLMVSRFHSAPTEEMAQREARAMVAVGGSWLYAGALMTHRPEC